MKTKFDEVESQPVLAAIATEEMQPQIGSSVQPPLPDLNEEVQKHSHMSAYMLV